MLRWTHTKKPLIDYLPEFQKAIYEESKNNKLKKYTTKYSQAKITTTRVRNIIEACKFGTRQDVTSEKVNEYIESRPYGMGNKRLLFKSNLLGGSGIEK